MTTLVATVLNPGTFQAAVGVSPTSEPFEVYVPLTGFSISPVSSNVVLNPAGTLATGTILLPLNPTDGQKLVITSTQTQTALTVTANTGDFIVGGPTALVAKTAVTLRYSLYGVVNGPGTLGVNARTWFPCA